ncbi:MAG TPA: FecR domain-containing protein [Bryobacteraceae bacterium]|nr:FecR domain-containing protein [Bryobacteraceae bacterium]
MSTEKTNPEQILDQTIAEIRAERMSDHDVQQAAARVWANLSQQVSTALAPDGALRSCADFQALMPAYEAKQLPDAQVWLLEDHIHRCPDCRNTLEAARTAKVAQIAPKPARRFFTIPEWRWAMAAALAVGVGLGTWGMRDHLLPAPGGPRGAVQSVDGFLYRVSDSSGAPLSVGTELSEREAIRTARGSRAMVRLADGSLVEMRERSELSLSRKRSGMTIHLDRGSVIVQAAKQREGRLYVATNDCLVSVKGTVFAVDRGTKGSRVAVIEGQVQVDEANQTELLHPGQQVSTDAALAPVPIKEEISWSQNLGQYLALLGEFSVMQTQLEQVAGPGLRYSSQLLGLVPDGTVLYVAIPNIGGMLGQAEQIFQDRLNQSQVLRDWWNSHGNPQQLSQELETVRGFSEYLGSEVVLTVARNSSGGYSMPLVMAEVTKSGFGDYLQQQVAQISGGGHLTVVNDPGSLPATSSEKGAFALLMNNVVVVSPDPSNLRAVAALIQQPGSGAFATTAFHQRIADAYASGVGWLFCADMEQILPQSVNQNAQRKDTQPSSHEEVLSRLGVYDMQHVLVERREIGGKTENRAVVTFSQPRRGMASWLAAPAPMGALDFVSPDASFAVAFVVKQPKAALDELFSAIQAVDPNFAGGQADFESHIGVSLVNDLAAPLGSDVAFAIDGPILPVPSWKFAIEVYDPAKLQQSIQTVISSVNSLNQGVGLTLTQTQVSGRTYYTLQSPKSPLSICYTYVNGYLVAAANQALVAQAASQSATGYTLTRSAGFKALQGRDGYSNFSAIVYQNLAPVVSPLADQLRAVGNLSPDFQKSIDALKSHSAPSLVYAYGQPDRIEVASTGSFFGFNLDTLAGAAGPFQVPGLVGRVTHGMQSKQ